MSDDLVQFLRARLDEDEKVARATHPVFLAWDYDHCVREVRDLGNGNELVHGVDPRYGEHIARHDPARVLAEVEAKRRSLARHQPHSMGGCRVCEAPHWGVQVCDHCYGRKWPCPDVLDLAVIYAGHPDYRDEWRP